jgi:hypothetical protein
MNNKKQYYKEYYKNNKDKYKKAILKFYNNDVVKYILYRTKSTSKNRNIEFNITEEDIIIPDVCPYLGIQINNQVMIGHGRHPDAPSLDRIDSSKGYIKGNVQVISDLANRMKQNATSEQLVTFAHNILKIHSEHLHQSNKVTS